MDLDVCTRPWEEPWEEAADFFWEVYCRERTLDHLNWLAKGDFAFVHVKAEPPDGELLREEIERLGREHQEALSRISLLQASEVAVRVPYPPVQDEELNGRLHIYLHTAAALALLLRSRDGYSEEVRDRLEEAWKAARRFMGGELLEWGAPADSDTFPWEHSALATTAIVLNDLSIASFSERNYEDAFHQVALASRYVMMMPEGYRYLSISKDYYSHRYRHKKYLPIVSGLNLGVVFEPGSDSSHPGPRSPIVSGLNPADVFKRLCASSKEKDWAQVAEDCRTFGEMEDPILACQELGEYGYWWEQAGYAMSKLEPRELAVYHEKQMRRLEDERAEEILASFFFQDPSLLLLPDTARRSLIEATRAWAWTKSGRLESVLNQIRLAVEALMYPTFWVPLSQWAGRDKGYKSEWLRGLMSDLGEKHPSLKHYRQMLMNNRLKELLSVQAPYNQDLGFVYEKLPAALRKLNEQRNQAEHDPTRVWRREEVASLFNEYLGIGCDGVLRRLARLYLIVKDM
ncbi:MAG: hypothetical protein Q8O86_00680 [Dehalococcoidia bacterium]|nr:hypothetical protein [Dehalococcoidia bacterium]